MKVLLLSPTRGLYDINNNPYNGGGWISSLQFYLEKENNLELALAFKTEGKESIKKTDRTIYYPIHIRKRSFLDKLIYYRYGYKKDSFDDSIKIKIKSIIDSFQPDIIHIFGTESDFCFILDSTSVPCIIHLQGLLNPICNAYYPPSINEYSFKHINDINEFWLHNGIIFNKKRMKLAAEREVKFLKKAKYIIGRTDWDYNISKLMNPDVEYFHIDEILRPEFYKAKKWVHCCKEMTLVSTLSTTIYKGLDLVLKAAKLLKERDVNFKWYIIGVNNGNFVKKIETLTQISSNDVNIEYLGVKKPNEIIEILLGSSIYIHPSYIDNSPNSLCEAQYLGVPCIATNVGGVPSLMKHAAEWLVPANDPFILTSKIVELYQNISVDNYKKSSTHIIEDRHNVSHIIFSLKNAYNKITNKN